jgi:hypothetical protein
MSGMLTSIALRPRGSGGALRLDNGRALNHLGSPSSGSHVSESQAPAMDMLHQPGARLLL